MRHFTQSEKQEAIDLYFDEKLTLEQVVERLGYPTRQSLSNWLKCDSRYGTTFKHGYYPLEIKRAAVEMYSAGGIRADDVARNLGIKSGVSVITWNRNVELFGYDGLIPKVRSAAMPIPKTPEVPEDPEELKRRCEDLELDNAILRQTIEVLKKDPGVDPGDLSCKEKTLVIDALKQIYPTSQLIEKLKLARSSYYYHHKALGLPDKYLELRDRVKMLFNKHDGNWGYRRLWAELRSGTDPVIVSEKVVRTIMRAENLNVVYIKKTKRHWSSYAGEISKAPDNLVKRNFHADAPNKLWLTDITQFTLPGFKCYLSPIIDCFDGQVVSWSISKNPNAELANTMLKAAIKTLTPGQRPIIHSDRGVHYRWPGWIAICKKSKLIRSMSKKGCSPDNSACEGFFGRLKNEFFYYRDWKGIDYKTFAVMLDNFIVDYNDNRIKKSLGWLSPVQYRANLGLAA